MLRDVIIFPVIDWSFQRQRPQQIAIELGRRGHRVFYLTERFAPASLPRPYLFWSSPADNVYVVQLRCPEPHPNIYKNLPSAEQVDALVMAINSMRQNCEIHGLVCIVDLPFWREAASRLDDKLLVYDCMDHHAGFKNNARRMLDEERRLIQEADLVITTSAGLAQQIASVRPNILIRNGCEAAHFLPQANQPIRSLSSRPVVGYFGVLDHWFDTELVALAARRNPQWDFVLIGRRQDCDLSKLRRISNVHLLDEVPYEVLPQYVRGFDVCMIPFQISDLTLHTNPVKMYEYLAAGKPVVGTAMPEIMIGGEGLVYVANDHEQFMDKLAEAMAGHADPGYIERRVAYAMNETWARRVDQLESALTDVTLHKSAADVSVSVPS